MIVPLSSGNASAVCSDQPPPTHQPSTGRVFAAIRGSVPLENDPAKLAAIKGPLMGVFGEHAFANPSNPKYDEKASAEAWGHVLAFLDKLTK